MKTNKLVIIIIVLALVLTTIIVAFVAQEKNKTNTSSESNTEVKIVNQSSNTKVEYSSDEMAEKYSDYSAKINLNNLEVEEGSGVQISNQTITISASGTYYFSGTSEDANIVVDAKGETVILVFDNCNIKSSTTSVINIQKAEKVIINIPENTTTTFTDSSSYTVFTDEEEPNSTIFSKQDLVINGKGTLVVNGNYKEGIRSKDGLKIIDVTLKVTAVDNGIRGKDYLGINGANITVNAGGDGIKTKYDETEDEGYLSIENATINIETVEDGIQAETILYITNSDITIKTTYEQATKTENDFRGMGFKGETTSTSSSEDSVSSKGLKAGTEITIESGTFNIDSTDDGIHTDGYIIINNGTFNISTGDDGIHADSNIVINDGNINITKSYEGIESYNIEINGGEISVVSSDDGINVNGTAHDGMGGGSTATADESQVLVINGGTIYVEADGDGLDSNGYIKMTGGTVIVGGSTNGGNGALDYDLTFDISGGTLVAYGPTGMWQNPSISSSQYSIAFSCSGNSGDKVELKDSNGKTIANFTAKRAYGMVCVSDSKLTKGETYTLYINGTVSGSQELTSIVTSNGSSSQNGGMMGGQGRRGTR